MKVSVHFLSYLAKFFQEWEMFLAKVEEKIKTHILCSQTPPPPRKSCRLWNNVEKYCTPGEGHMEIWCMRIACWITKATNTRAAHVIFIAFPWKEWLVEHASMFFYTYTDLE
jgi:hypothetical protein